MNVNAALLAALLALGACGCFSRDPIDVKSRDPASKIPAIKRAVRDKDLTTARELVKDLDSDDPAVRFYAISGLERLTGERFGYDYYADEDRRKPAIKRWQDWLAAEENRDSGFGSRVSSQDRKSADDSTET